MTDDVSLLLHRVGFSPTSAEMTAARKAGYGVTLTALTAPAGPDLGAAQAPVPKLGLDPYADKPNPSREQRAAADHLRRVQTEQIIRWWLDRMIVANHQAVEKLLFFWHGHWATSIDKVRSPQLMLAQHRTLRAAPDFRIMARQMVVDPALVYWLDGHLNTRRSPNENLARELMELFLLGIGQYTEKDVKEAGRALTGWWVNLGAEKCVFDARLHDSGSKTTLGTTRNFTAESLVDLLLSQKVCARFLASRMWFRYASSTEPIPERTMEKMAAAFPAPMAMLRELFTDDAFRATNRNLVKQPVEWLVGAMRQLRLRLGKLPADVVKQILDGLKNLGQLPFAPPSVGGWPSGAAWLTSGAAEIRLRVAGVLAERAQLTRLTPEDLAGILCVDTWTNRTYSVLREVRDPRQMLTLGLVAPEYLVT